MNRPEPVDLSELLDEIEVHGSPCRCRGKTEDWFRTDPAGVQAAIDACAWCPVLDACRRYTEQARPGYGVWAGQFFYPQGHRAGTLPGQEGTAA